MIFSKFSYSLFEIYDSPLHDYGYKNNPYHNQQQQYNGKIFYNLQKQLQHYGLIKPEFFYLKTFQFHLKKHPPFIHLNSLNFLFSS